MKLNDNKEHLFLLVVSDQVAEAVSHMLASTPRA